MYTVLAAFLCLAAVPVTPIHHDIHKRMTTEEVLGVFQTDHENVPSYDIVRIESSRINKRAARSDESLHITSSDKMVNEILNPTDGYLVTDGTPVMIAESLSDGTIEYKNMEDAWERMGTLMENIETQTSVVVSKTSSGLHAFNGYIGSHNMVIRSLPEHLDMELSRTARPVNDSVSSDGGVYHAMYKPKERSFDPDSSITPLNDTVRRRRASRTQSIPEIIYPEILIVVDHNTYRLHGSEVSNILTYLRCLWNTADMRYRQIINPKIRLNLAQIIIAKESRGTPYIVVEGNKVPADKALDLAGEHFYSQRERIPLDRYDAVMMMTTLEVLNDKGNSVAGRAKVGAACLIYEHLKQFAGTGIYHDVGGYGSEVVAHELGHILGANHDDSEKCTSENGYLMAPQTTSSVNSWSLSECSVRGIGNFLSSDKSRPECLFNKPKSTGKLFPRIVPRGNLDKQCQNWGYEKSCSPEKPKHICLELTCERNKGCWALHGRGAAVGTPCNGRGICVLGRCVRA